MQVKKRNGNLEPVKLDKITRRIEFLCDGLSSAVDAVKIAIETTKSLHDGITTSQLDMISARIANEMALTHPDYGVLAGRICVSNLHKTTPDSFSAATELAARQLGTISRRHYHYVRRNAAALDAMINHGADYSFDYFGFSTLESGYLLHRKVGQPPHFTREIIDRPQYMWMRVAVAAHADTSRLEPATAEELALIRQTYKMLSSLLFTHATPTLYNSMGRTQQLNSCFLLSTADSIEEIQRTISNTSKISKWAGGIGVAFHDIRAAGSLIRGTGGASSGLPKQLKIYNDAARTWDQGGKRKGAYAAYLEPWHADIMEFLELKKNQGADEVRARDLFYAMWVPDLFVARARDDAQWSLFSEDTAPGLSDVYDGMRVCSACGYCANRNYFKLVGRGVIDASATLSSAPDETIISAKLDVNSYYDNEVEAAHDMSGGRHSKFREVNNGVASEERFDDWRKANETCGQSDDGEHKWVSRDVFSELYGRYEAEGRAMKTLPAREVLSLINELQRETGTPYVCFKDHMNRRSNQANIGTLRSSNLCAEITQWHSEYSYANCCLASINLRAFVRTTSSDAPNSSAGHIDHVALHETVKVVARNLDNIVDANDYPVAECVDNAVNFRPIGIGIQGLADVFAMLRLPFLSAEAAAIDIEMAETIYHAALETSADLAEERGAYKGWSDSPAAAGMLQFDMWAADIDRRRVDIFGSTGLGRRRQSARTTADKIISARYDWDALRARIAKVGLRNSLSVAMMPTASTSQIMGNNESFEPFAGNISTKSTLFGKFVISNKYMIRHLHELGLWSDEMRDHIMAGSIRDAPGVPANVAEIYLTVWEMSQRELMRRAALRGAFVDQSQSLNVYVSNNSDSVLRAIFFAGWEFGLKTGTYYTRSQPAAVAMRNNLTRSSGSTPTLARARPKLDLIKRSTTVRPLASSAPVITSADPDVCYPGCDSCGA